MSEQEPYSSEWTEALLKRLEALEAMHQETTHIHESILLETAHEIILKVYTSGLGGLTLIPGLTFDMANWLEWYASAKKEQQP